MLWIPLALLLLKVDGFVSPPPRSSHDTSLSIYPAPDGKSYLPFQVQSIQGLSQSKGILLADEMGLGKTISVIGALNWLQHLAQPHWQPRVLIVAPKSVLPNWQWELSNWLVQKTTVGTATCKGLPPDDPHVLLINYDIVDKYRDELEEVKWDIVVCDEAHFLKNRDAIRTRAILGDLGAGKRKSPLKTERLWLVTGSPLLNNPSELYSLLRSIDDNCTVIPELNSMETFSEQYSNKRIAPWGVYYGGGRNLAELRQRLKQIRPNQTPLMIRRTKAEVLPDLPPKRHQLLPLWDHDGQAASGELMVLQNLALKMGGSSKSVTVKSGLEKMRVPQLKALLKENNLKVSGKKQELIERLQQHGIQGENRHTDHESYTDASQEEEERPIFHSAQSALRSQGSGNTIVKELLSVLNDKDINTTQGESDAIRGLLAQARHETARQKLPHAIELIQQAIEESDQKVVVFAHHRDVQSELKDAFGKTAVGITGGDSLEDRADAVQRFQTDPKVRVFVGSILAAGTGITLNAASHVIFVELDWSPLVVQQAEDRCHRVGQRSSVLVQYLFFPDTIDEFLSQLLASKSSTITAAIDGASGGPASWVFDFGKHYGLCVADVAGSDPYYLKWLVNSDHDILERKPELAAALSDLGFVKEKEKEEREECLEEEEEKVVEEQEEVPVQAHIPTVQNPTPQKNGQEVRSNPGSYVVTFGKHKGHPLAEIPTGYLNWLRASGASRRNPTMSSCLHKHLAERQLSKQKQSQ